MPMTGSGLKTAVVNVLYDQSVNGVTLGSTLTDDQKTTIEQFWLAISDAIITYISNNAIVSATHTHIIPPGTNTDGGITEIPNNTETVS